MAPTNRGHMEQRGGIWHVRLSKGSGKDRRRDWYTLETGDERIAERRRAALVEQIAAGKTPHQAARAIPVATTVNEWAESWNAKRAGQGVVSASDDEQRIRDYALDEIGSFFVGDVKPAHIQKILDDAAASGRSKETVSHIKAALSRLFKAAWRLDMITENPVDKVELPRAREDKRKRVILTDPEFEQLMAYLGQRVAHLDAWELEHGRPEQRDGSRELRMLCACARMLGGMRTSDVNSWDWAMVDTLHFANVVVPRTKTDEPQDLTVPPDLRGVIWAWWRRQGSPTSGPVFPALRGDNKGGFKAKRGTSYADRLRKACKGAGLTRPELYRNTARTRRVDFHSFRRAAATALANTRDLSMQQAMKLTAHADPRTHLRYVSAPTEIPASALPRLITSDNERMATTYGQSADASSEPARHSGFEPLAFGSGGRSDDHARTETTASDEDPDPPSTVAGDPRKPADTPDWPGLATAKGSADGASGDVSSNQSDHIIPRVPPEASVRAGQHLELGLRIARGDLPSADPEAAALAHLATAYDLLGLGGAS